ncbi:MULTISPECIES: hypothetical protein [unclassified Spirillospora]|uniref:hypothetical protein n=1 Tax=unclassified Spirillospora TaxID=2642701 RepID=UPI00371940F9
MTKGDGKGGPSNRPARSGAGGNAKPASASPASTSPASKRQQQVQGWGCVTVFALLIVGGILWSLYDEGVFEKKAAKDAPVFGPQQTGRLVEQLSTAADAQGICYGWVIDSGRNREIKPVTPSYPGTFRPHPPKQAPAPVSAPAPVPTGDGHFSSQGEIEYDLNQLDGPGVEFGSNLGPGKDPRQTPGQCPKWVILEARYSYSESYGEYSFGRFEIKSSFDERFREATFERRLGQVGEDDIDGEYGTARLRDAIGALPMLVADEGLAPPVPAETSRAAQAPPNDRLAESTITARAVWTVIGIGLLAVAIVVLTVGAVRNLRSRSS